MSLALIEWSRLRAMLVCEAVTHAGKPCRNAAVTGAALCASHIVPRRAGRPPAVTPAELLERIEPMLRSGVHLNVAVLAAGGTRATVYQWWIRGRADGARANDEPCRRFRRACEQARSDGEQRLVRLVAEAAERDPKHAEWLLERGWPDRWGPVAVRRAKPEPVEAPPVLIEPPAAPSVEPEADPFAAIDELAEQRRRRHAGE